MPNALAGASRGVHFRLQDKKLAERPPPQDPCSSLTLGSSSAHAAPALVAHTQGGITLGLGEGDLGADFCHLGRGRWRDERWSLNLGRVTVWGF